MIIISQKIFVDADAQQSLELLCSNFITPIEDMISLSDRGDSNN